YKAREGTFTPSEVAHLGLATCEHLRHPESQARSRRLIVSFSRSPIPGCVDIPPLQRRGRRLLSALRSALEGWRGILWCVWGGCPRRHVQRRLRRSEPRWLSHRGADRRRQHGGGLSRGAGVARQE